MQEKATNLQDALAVLGPSALEFVEGENPFYVPRGDDPLRVIRTRLMAQRSETKFLLAGHRGSGKSTELNRLAVEESIRSRYAIVKYSVQDHLDLVDLDYIDLLFLSTALTFDQLVTKADDPLELEKEIVDELDRWRRVVVEKMEDESEGSATTVEGGAKLSLLKTFFAGFQQRLRAEKTTRRITRETIEPRLSEFLETLRIFYGEVDSALAGRDQRLFLIVEDLDKIPDIEKARKLFHEKGPYLTQPPCTILYTVPIAIHYDPEFQEVARTFGHSVFLPNIPLRTRDGVQYERGHRLMKEFVTRRLAPALVDSEALDRAVAVSGGVFQQIQRLMDHACVRALGLERRGIEDDDVEHASRDLRFSLERALASEHYGILDEVEKSQKAPSDPETLRLLHSLHLIEYRNDERWCQINPLLDTTLENWREQEEERRRHSNA